MTIVRSRRKPRTLLAPVLAALVLFQTVPSPARAEVDCLQPYVNCVEAASELDSVPTRSWAGLRCAYELLSCLQRRLA
ncbi:MAG TPA: hypothetical protein VGK86_07230 [Thermoanaerobaculia bacterium]